MVPTGEPLVCDDASEPRSMLLDRDDDDDMDRRNDVRRLCGENREVMDWKREFCMVAVGWICDGVGMRMKLVREGEMVLIGRVWVSNVNEAQPWVEEAKFGLSENLSV